MSVKSHLQNNEDVNTRVAAWEKKTEAITLTLSLAFLAVLILPLARPLSNGTEHNLNTINKIIWIIFALDYIYKILISSNKPVFVRTHVFELLIVIIPGFRAFRLLRMFPVIGYFLKYTQKSLSGKLLQYVSLAAVLITFPAAVAMYQLEKNLDTSNIKTLGDALWWAATTATTVGYGDKFPVSAGGRLLSLLVMVVGISLVGVITASVASWFVKSDESESDQLQIADLKKELQEIKDQLRKLSS
jgi:voltage-gated potassium channel